MRNSSPPRAGHCVAREAGCLWIIHSVGDGQQLQSFNVLSKRVTNVANAVSSTDAVPLGMLNGPLSANITLTTATSDSVSINGVTASSKCSFTPSNSTAAGVVSTLAGYYTTTTNSFALHPMLATSASGATYGVICTIQ